MTADAGRLRRRRRLLIRLLIVVAVIGVLATGAAVWLHQALPRIAAREIGRLLNARVETGAIDLCLDGSVSVAGLVVRPKQEESRYDNTILRAENIYARFDRRSLLSLSPRVTDLRLEDFLLDVQLDLNTGRWNVGTLRLNASSGQGGGIPTINLLRGKLRYCKISGAQQEVVMSIPIEARFGREAEGDPGYSFEIKTAKLSGGYGDSRLSGHWRPYAIREGPGYALPEPAELTLAGGLSSADIPSLERAWAIDVLAADLTYDRSGNYTMDLRLKDLHGKHAPEVDALRFLAPGAEKAGLLRNLQEFFAEYQPTGTVGSITIRASGNLPKWQDSEIEGKLICKDVSICDSDFPYRIDHLSGELEFTQSSLHLNRLVGKHGAVEVHIDGWTRESGGDRQYQYQITSRNMVLDQALYAALNSNEKRLWDALRPTGMVGVDYRLTRTSPTDKRLYMSVGLNDVTATFQGFPYPLTGLTGTLFFDRNSIAISDVVSRAGNRQVRLNGKVTEPTVGKPNYYLSVDAKDVPLDATLRDALPVRYRELFHRFDLSGSADIRARVFSREDVNEATETKAVATEDPNNAGRSGSEDAPRVSFLAEISCRNSSLKLPSSQLSAERRPASLGDAAPVGRSPSSEVQPLILSDITAEATITPESVSLRKLEGRHGRSPVAMNGGLLFGPGDKLKQCRMKITAQQVPVNEALIGLLPASLTQQAAAFHLEGDVDLVVNVEQADGNEPPGCTVVMNCLGDRISHERFAYPLRDVRGTVTFTKDGLVVRNLTARPDDGGLKPEGTGPEAADGAALRPPSSVLRVDGSATVARGGLEKGTFTLKATDLLFTESLARALPKTLAGPYRELSPQGPFDLDVTTLKVSQAAADETLVEFGGKADLKTCRVKVSNASMEFLGVLEAEGSYSTKHGLSRGRTRLAAERLVVKGKAITHADIGTIYDPNTRNWTATNFTGDCYGGRLLGDLVVKLPQDKGLTTENGLPSSAVPSSSSGLEYQLQVALQDVDLQRFLAAGGRTDGGEQKSGETELLSSVLRSASSTSSGTMDASLSLLGRVGDSQPAVSSAGASGAGPVAHNEAAGRRGICRIHVANMQVGKVSPLGTVLSVLRLSEPTDYTFERMLIDSYIRGDKLLIPKIDLSGRNAAFAGSGTMDFPTEEINLTLTGRSHRVAATGPSVLQSLTESLSGAVVRMEVTGKASSPRVQTKTLPLIEDSLRILGTPEENKKPKK